MSRRDRVFTPRHSSPAIDTVFATTHKPSRLLERDQLRPFAYALTCHKAQGSQWRSVIVVDESEVCREIRNRWLYTAITRAQEKVTVVR